MGTSPRTGLVTQPTQPDFFNHSQLVLYFFIVYLLSSFLQGTLAPRDIGTPSRSTGTLESRDIGTPCKRLSLTQHTSADLHIQPIQRCRVILRPHGCESNAFHTQGCVCVINASLTVSRHLHITGFPRSDRGHHVPALTVTSGERGVGFVMLAWGRLVVFTPAGRLCRSCQPVFN